jgi:hypothetical protein
VPAEHGENAFRERDPRAMPRAAVRDLSSIDYDR